MAKGAPSISNVDNKTPVIISVSKQCMAKGPLRPLAALMGTRFAMLVPPSPPLTSSPKAIHAHTPRVWVSKWFFYQFAIICDITESNYPKLCFLQSVYLQLPSPDLRRLMWEDDVRGNAAIDKNIDQQRIDWPSREGSRVYQTRGSCRFCSLTHSHMTAGAKRKQI